MAAVHTRQIIIWKQITINWIIMIRTGYRHYIRDLESRFWLDVEDITGIFGISVRLDLLVILSYMYILII